MSLRAVSVKINNKAPVVDSISYDNSIAVKVGNQQDYKVKTLNMGVSKLSQLLDVDVNNPNSDDFLIYNSDIRKYESRQVNLQDLNIDTIDAGLF